MDGEGDAIAEKNDAVDRAFGAGEDEDFLVAGSFVEQILKGRGGKIYNASETRGWSVGVWDQGCMLHIACFERSAIMQGHL